MQLLVNIDHVATLRNARGEGYPDPADAATVCEQAGASGIVFHLRRDRRHIRDEDVYRLKKFVKGTLDFEMSASDEMIEICKDVEPHLCTLVPEGREELTTEGGLDMKVIFNDFKNRVFPALHGSGIKISLFLDPNPEDIELAHNLGADAIELHTGTFANAPDEDTQQKELERLSEAAELIHNLGMIVNAGHGLNLQNLPILIDHVNHLEDISIGHALISKSVFWGLERTVKEYLKIMNK
ncbi:pyridoxine 5'-phosphate synthase [Rhodohalobacter sulfatireducens]|uniref:Pyridoxine 5'-phosphate synthase n=1 Tax=Rhodohalobacter sulfatireducens TaxID=2911366 RepID=A0ABS9KHQ2_9BACT|nr:pyridoxine 5'-phosphate synthase [Rhodohalobacter sulfatireducens]MCG2590378.1 pyridoxine 5'-phosphate synthase [Rhodohalobacter sulfatireducens]MDR9409255.1 pyridoxine 5'-phosphate synthase [Balneolaceae bacterium]